MLRYAVLCCAVLYCAVRCGRGSVPRCVALRYVMLCYVMLCYVALCYVMLCYVMSCYVMFKVLSRMTNSSVSQRICNVCVCPWPNPSEHITTVSNEQRLIDHSG